MNYRITMPQKSAARSVPGAVISPCDKQTGAEPSLFSPDIPDIPNPFRVCQACRSARPLFSAQPAACSESSRRCSSTDCMGLLRRMGNALGIGAPRLTTLTPRFLGVTLHGPLTCSPPALRWGAGRPVAPRPGPGCPSRFRLAGKRPAAQEPRRRARAGRTGESATQAASTPWRAVNGRRNPPRAVGLGLDRSWIGVRDERNNRGCGAPPRVLLLFCLSGLRVSLNRTVTAHR